MRCHQSHASDSQADQDLIVKWLGPNAVNPLLVDGKGGRTELIPAVRRWVAANGRSITLPVMVVSYETLRSLEDELAGCPVGLLLCDEGHRLKNSGEPQRRISCVAGN